jgi:hypothetical protein
VFAAVIVKIVTSGQKHDVATKSMPTISGSVERIKCPDCWKRCLLLDVAIVRLWSLSSILGNRFYEERQQPGVCPRFEKEYQ